MTGAAKPGATIDVVPANAGTMRRGVAVQARLRRVRDALGLISDVGGHESPR